MDLTIETYNKLLGILQNKGFVFQSFVGFIQKPGKKVIILRHDVDKLPENSLTIARLESSLGVRGSYYFRSVPSGHNEEIIRNVAELGHEVGYHYEDVSLAAERQKTKVKRQKYKNQMVSDLQDRKTARPQDNTNIEEELALIAIESFKENLAKLREIVPVKTICMHGSPLSKWDSRLLWKYYDYRDFGIIGEQYFDIDFNKVCYITDTGRMWDGDSFNIRDKGTGNRQLAIGEEYLMPHAANLKPFPTFHTTFDIIRAAEEDRLPDKIMMTFHPQRWTDKPVPWVRELVGQNVKNVGKYFLVKWRDKEEVGSRKLGLHF